MKISTSGRPQFQQGASVFSLLLIAAMVGMFLLAGLKLTPAYMDNNVITNGVEGALANNNLDEISIGQFRSEVMKTVNVNRVDGFDSSSIIFTEEGNLEYIDVNYETRVPLFYNIDAVVKFENRFEL